MQYDYVVKPKAAQKIWSFYRNVSLKFLHTYSEEDMVRNIQSAVRSIRLIEKNIPRRVPIVDRWKGYYMAKAGKWYFAYTIDEETVIVWDACHAQNMHD